MRITFILPPVGMSGGIRVVAIYARALMDRGHVVCLVSPPHPPPPLRRRLKTLFLGWPSIPAPRSHLDDRGLDHRVIGRCRPINDSDVPDADVVIATWFETAEWVNALAPCKGAKVYFVQGHEVFPYLPVERCHATYRLPMHKIVVSEWLKRTMRTLYHDDNVDLVPNSVDHAQFFAAARNKQPVPTVGLLYSTSPLKGLDVALGALRLARARMPDLRIVSFGTEKRGPGAPLPEGAEFFFSPPQDQLRTIYARCDVWIAASRSEGFNLPAMEAMACRTPVVATCTGWPEEAVKSAHNGVLVGIDDWNGLAEGTQWVLSRNNDEWSRLSENAYNTVASSNWQASVDRFERALENACSRSARGEIAGKCACDVERLTALQV